MIRINKYRWEIARMRAKKVIFIKPTMRCNLDCPYCAVNFAKGRRPIYSEKMPLFWMNLIDKEKPDLLVISGGEPALYSELHKVVNYAVARKVLVKIVTNLSITDNFVKIKPSWRILFFATYHSVFNKQRFINNYKLLNHCFTISVRELGVVRHLSFSRLSPINEKQVDNHIDIYAPNGTLYHSCKELDENGK